MPWKITNKNSPGLSISDRMDLKEKIIEILRRQQGTLFNSENVAEEIVDEVHKNLDKIR